MVLLHDAVQTMHNGVFVFFLRTKTCFFSYNPKNGLKKQKNRWVGFLSTLITFQSFFVISLDRTICNKSRHYQFDWMCTPHTQSTRPWYWRS